MRLLCPWDSPGKNTGVGCHLLLQRIFPTQGSSSLVAQSVKSLPAMRETPVSFLGQEDPLEKDMVTHSSILAWRLQWTEQPDGLQFMGSQSWTWLSSAFAFTPGDLPNPGIKPRSPPLQADSLLSEPPGEVYRTKIPNKWRMLAFFIVMATHSSILAWRIPWMEDPGGLQSMGSAKSQTWLSDFTSWSSSRRPPEARLKESQKFIRPPETKLKEYRACPHPNP